MRLDLLREIKESNWLYFYPHKDGFIQREFANDIQHLERKPEQEQDQYEDWEDEFSDDILFSEDDILLVDLRRGKFVSVEEAQAKVRRTLAPSYDHLFIMGYYDYWKPMQCYAISVIISANGEVEDHISQHDDITGRRAIINKAGERRAGWLRPGTADYANVEYVKANFVI